jgi:hypothetical protein
MFCYNDQRFCKYSENNGSHFVEDDYHVLLICPLYSDLRNTYIVTHIRRFMPSDVVFIQIMSIKNDSFIEDLAVFIYNMFKIHAHYNFSV